MIIAQLVRALKEGESILIPALEDTQAQIRKNAALAAQGKVGLSQKVVSLLDMEDVVKHKFVRLTRKEKV